MPTSTAVVPVERIDRSWISGYRDKLQGAEVFQTPMHGHDLAAAVRLGGMTRFVNLGKVMMVEFEDGSGRNFNVATQLSDGPLFVRLAPGVDTPYF